ncbi:MAG: NERD domain-containing protein [Clostridia bacterium]|nr:NERD domain-containing protein [Clostridia bacterium]
MYLIPIFIVAIIILLIIYIVVSNSSAKNQYGSEKSHYIDTHRKYGAELKGQIGEEYVISIINNFKYPNEYLLNDLIIPSLTDKTSQIDHLFINKNGIWVIETKNYSGRIYGMHDSANWTEVVEHNIIRYRRGIPRVIGKRHRKYSFRNPIKQNATHIYNLKKTFDLKGVDVKGLVVFSDADISGVSAQNVCNLNQMMNYLHNTDEGKLSEKQVKDFFDKFSSYKQNNDISLNTHIENIHKIQSEIASGICPRCGNQLRKINGKYGDFLGCTAYPKCKFKKKID